MADPSEALSDLRALRDQFLRGSEARLERIAAGLRRLREAPSDRELASCAAWHRRQSVTTAGCSAASSREPLRANGAAVRLRWWRAHAVRDTHETPRRRYPVGKDAALLVMLPRLVPDRLLDRLRMRLFGLPTRFGALAAAEKCARSE
jgi:hypothetical protein